MPVQRREIPDCFEVSEDRKSVMCRLCTPKHTLKQNWIAASSLKGHVDSAMHAKAVSKQNYEKKLRERMEAHRRTEVQQRQENQRLTDLRNVNIPAPSTLSTSSQVEDPLWTFWELRNEDFSIEPDAQEIRATKLQQEVNHGADFWNTSVFGDFQDQIDEDMREEEAENDLLAIINSALVNAEEQHLHPPDGTNPASRWYPYNSKVMFLLDLLDNLPRLRVSNTLMQVILWILKQLGVPDVPSFKHLRACQEKIRKESGIPSIACKSPQGNVFHINDPRAIISKDWTNPDIRRHIQIYPEIPADGVIREIWHAEKWRKDMDLRNLSPMYNANGIHYYVFELCQLRDKQLVVPIRWLLYKGSVYADAFKVEVNEITGEASIRDGISQLICAADLLKNFLDLQDTGVVPSWDDSTILKGYPTQMPNPDRALAQGDPMYSSFVDYFGDDVSGNRSKSWNKHWNSYITHRNLPRKLLFQEYNVHFISTSPNATISEQFHMFKKVIQSTHTNPVQFRDPLTNDTARFRIFGNSGPSDNPMQSEICSHMGQNANHSCRKCKVGGSRQDKVSDEGFHSLFSAGEHRSGEEVLLELRAQLRLACEGVAARITERQTETGTKDPFTQYWIDDILERFRTMRAHNCGIPKEHITAELLKWIDEHDDDTITAFLTLRGFDPTKDTPVEILHTFLLGIVKYVWHATHTSWSDDQKKLYSLRLQSTLRQGMSIPEIRSNYIMQFANSLIGRQLKIVIQCSVFHLHNLVDDDLLQVWKAVGELSALIWVPEIRNLKEYIADVEIAVANVLDTFAKLDPSKMPAKSKLHLLTHLTEDIKRFGPLVGLSTEVFESFNSVFRSCSILSNHLAPSRDIALQLANQEGLKQRTSRGWWYSLERDEWVQAGSGVQEFVSSQPTIRRLLGWSNDSLSQQVGSVKLSPLSREGGKPRPERQALPLKSTNAARAINSLNFNQNTEILSCQLLISQSGDECRGGTWIVAESPLDSNTVIGCIDGIYQYAQQPQDGSSSNITVVEVFSVSDHRHDTLGLPVLYQPQAEGTYLILSAGAVKFNFNAQHDCRLAECDLTGTRRRQQERQDSEITDVFVEHKPLKRFIVNLNSFHNLHLIRDVLPRGLVKPCLIYSDREAHHAECAQSLRKSQGKRAVELAARKRAREEAGEVSD
ncbi:hypothetical protein PQX77_015698 [Marasmius sp. AFHP31]|nr:hypothetical protein PQX77_015698 [Marasmius sp. AFHP31]